MQGYNMGRYVPPELEGVLSFNQASGKKPTNRTPDGSQVVRFECPFAIWCTNCQPEQIIGQGVRFNAEKRKVGNYYSTAIWSFSFKHTLCGAYIEVRTDPKNTEYVVFGGGRRRDTGLDKVLDGEILIGRTSEEKDKIEKDGAFGLLERNVKEKEVVDIQKARVEELRKRQERDWADPYEMNKKIRKDFRVGRRQRQSDEKTAEALQDKFGLGVDLIAPVADDSIRASLIDFIEDKVSSPAMRSIFHTKNTSRHVSSGKTQTKTQNKHDPTVRRKLALQDRVTGNARARSDPFIKEGEVWVPTVQRRVDGRKAAEDKATELNEEKVEKQTALTEALVAYESGSD